MIITIAPNNSQGQQYTHIWKFIQLDYNYVKHFTAVPTLQNKHIHVIRQTNNPKT